MNNYDECSFDNHLDRLISQERFPAAHPVIDGTSASQAAWTSDPPHPMYTPTLSEPLS